MPTLVWKKAPAFSAKAVVNGGEVVPNFSLDQYHGQKFVVLFFYPKDFSGLCPTELHAFQEKLGEFEARNCVVVGCSTDTERVHQVWLQTDKAQGGVQGITYPLVADTNKTIAYNYGVLTGEYDMDEDGNLVASGELVSFRGLFIIDKNGVVQHELVNSLPIGRNVDEVLRMVDAIQFNQEHGEICPANWRKEATEMANS